MGAGGRRPGAVGRGRLHGVTAVGYTHADATGNEPRGVHPPLRPRRPPRVVEDLRLARLRDRLGRRRRRACATVTGYTFGDLDADNKGSFDVFVRRYGPDGALKWNRQFGTGEADLGIDVAADGKGFTVLGHTMGALGGDPRATSTYSCAATRADAARHERADGTFGVAERLT